MSDLKQFILITLALGLVCCTPKGPQDYFSPFIGKTKNDLIIAKGIAKEIKIFDAAEAHIYKNKEAYYGKKTSFKNPDNTISPKKVIEIEHIYYINENGIIYKYQVWKKKIK